jgi:hypothetical protein
MQIFGSFDTYLYFEMNDRFQPQSRAATDVPSATLPGASRRPVRFSLSPSHDIAPANGLANAQETS